jgi:hypothetical protein
MPLVTALWLPLCLLPLFLTDSDVLPTGRVLAGALAVPLFAARFAGATTGKNNPWARDYYGVSSFTATRPMTTAGLVAAKLRMAAIGGLASWALVLAGTAAALLVTGKHAEVRGWWRAWLGAESAPKVAVTLAAVVGLLALLTWKPAVDNLLVGLTGREWYIKGYTVAAIGGMFVLAMFGSWLYTHPEYHQTARGLVPWATGAVVGLKLFAGAAAVRALRRRGLVADRVLAWTAAAWLAVAGGLFAALAWVLPREVMPLARLATTPLALDWNRHR